MRLIILLASVFLTNTAWATDFTKCEDASQFPELASSICATIKPPQSYVASNENETNNEIELFIRKFPSIEKQSGSLWLVAGGPGESGASFYAIIDTFRTAFPSFDIFIPDHRGTGFSSAICPGEDVTSTAGKLLVGEEWGACFSHMYTKTDYVKAFSITNAAKDLRFLINTMSSDGQKYVYGVSYGTQLVLRAAQLEGFNVDGIILDSLVPMQDDAEFDLSKRSQVVNSVGDALLEKCNSADKCLGQSAKNLKAKLTKLMAKSKSLKQFSNELPDTHLSHVLGTLLDVPHLRNELPNIITALSNNNVVPLKKAIEDATNHYNKFNAGYANFGSSIPLVQIITASENNLRTQLTKADVQEEEQHLLFTSPVPHLMAENSMPTYSKGSMYATLPASVPITLVLHGTLDPKTHYDAAKSHTEALRKSGKVTFTEITDGVHFTALNAPECFTKNVKHFVKNGQALASVCVDNNVKVKF